MHPSKSKSTANPQKETNARRKCHDSGRCVESYVESVFHLMCVSCSLLVQNYPLPGQNPVPRWEKSASSCFLHNLKQNWLQNQVLRPIPFRHKSTSWGDVATDYPRKVQHHWLLHPSNPCHPCHPCQSNMSGSGSTGPRGIGRDVSTDITCLCFNHW